MKNKITKAPDADFDEARTALYRHFDSDGRLLYVGISLNPASRQSNHSQNAEWYSDISEIKLEWFETRYAAATAEIAAIENENPKHNKLANPEWSGIRSLQKAQGLLSHECAHIRVVAQAGGVKAVAARLGVGDPAITLAQRAQSFPASWFNALEELTGSTLDRSLFKFK